MKLLQFFPILIICLLLGAGSGYFVNKCSGPVILSDTIRDTIPGDSIPYPVVLKVKDPVPVYRDTGSIQWRDRSVDTLAIIADYYTINYYDDTVSIDSLAMFRLKSHVTQNRLHYDSCMRQIYKPTLLQTTINQPAPVRKWAVYTGIGFTNCPETGIMPSLLLTTPGRFAYSAGYDLSNKASQATVYYKFAVRKPHDPCHQ